MQNNANLTLKQLITEINELLNEIKNEEMNISNIVEKNHKVNMQKFSKIIEFNEICDMTNQVFEKRLSAIETKLNSIIEKKRVK
jgi:hypothetical protein